MNPVVNNLCPLCDAAADPAQGSCPQCDSDLAGYWRILYRPWAHYNRALELCGAGDLPAAARQAEIAAALDSREPSFSLLAAEILAELGELDEAVEFGTTALDLGEEDPAALELIEQLFAARLEARKHPQGTPPDTVAEEPQKPETESAAEPAPPDSSPAQPPT